MKLNPLSLPIEQVKQPSPSTNPANHLSFKLGKIEVCFTFTALNFIFPLDAHTLNPSTNLSKLFCLLGNIILPLNIFIIIYISNLLWVIYLLVVDDWAITLPKPKVSFIKCNTCISIVLCEITKAKSPLLFTMKDPSPSTNPIYHCKKDSLGLIRLGYIVLNLS